MNWYHKLLITLVVGLFLFIHQDVIIENYRDNSPVLSSEEITKLEKQVTDITVIAKEKIKSGTYSPSEWQQHVYFLQTQVLQKFGGRYSREKFFVESGKILDYTIKNYYEPKTKDPVEGLLFQQEINSAQANVLHENNVGVDWSKFVSSIWSFYLSFIFFTFLIILIKRSTVYLKIHSAGDVVVVALCTLFSVIGTFAYKPNSLLQKTIDAELKVWQEKIGTRGWRLALAYMLAILFAIGTILRPIKIYAQEIFQHRVTITQMVELESEDESLEFNLPIVAIARNYFVKIIRVIQKYIFLFFSPMFVTLNIPPPRSFIIISWQTPRDKIVLSKIIIGCRAPSILVQFNLINRTKTKNKGIYSEKHFSNIINLFGS